MVKSFPAILVGIALELGLAGAAVFLGLRLLTRKGGPTTTMALFIVAVVFGIAAIASVTFLGKSKSG